MSSNCYDRCIRWQRWRTIGILIGWLVFVPSFLMLVSVWNANIERLGSNFENNFQFSAYQKYRFYFKLTFALTNFWAIVCWLYGVTFYKAICMLTPLIWYGFVEFYFAYSIYTGANRFRLESVLLLIPLWIVPYILSIFSYAFIRKVTEHTRRRNNSTMANLHYVTIQRLEDEQNYT